MRATNNLLLAAVVLILACDVDVPSVHVREARPGEVAVVRRETMTMTVHKLYRDKKVVALYSATGIPDHRSLDELGRGVQRSGVRSAVRGSAMPTDVTPALLEQEGSLSPKSKLNSAVTR